MNYKEEQRIVMTLDAGGTNFVFSAIAGGKEIVEPFVLPSVPTHIDHCLKNIVTGFHHILKLLPATPVAISFAFPGPADYEAGIIGDLPNFPAFRGGVALGPYLQDQFGLPVFINNDGNLFAYGEAMTGILPEINNRLKEAGSTKRYQNIIGITLGTGFGAGVVTNGQLLLGDNAAGGDLWCLRNKNHPQFIVEESVSIRAIKRMYAERSSCKEDLTPKDIYEIAEGNLQGEQEAARASFAELGEVAAEALSCAITLVDGLVVIGGGLAGASKYILPAMIKELNGTIRMMDGSIFNRLQMKVFNLEDETEFASFAGYQPKQIKVPDTPRFISYDLYKRTGIAVTHQGTSRSISLGAYTYALNQLDNQ